MDTTPWERIPCRRRTITKHWIEETGIHRKQNSAIRMGYWQTSEVSYKQQSTRYWKDSLRISKTWNTNSGGPRNCTKREDPRDRNTTWQRNGYKPMNA